MLFWTYTAIYFIFIGLLLNQTFWTPSETLGHRRSGIRSKCQYGIRGILLGIQIEMWTAKIPLLPPLPLYGYEYSKHWFSVKSLDKSKDCKMPLFIDVGPLLLRVSSGPVPLERAFTVQFYRRNFSIDSEVTLEGNNARDIQDFWAWEYLTWVVSIC